MLKFKTFTIIQENEIKTLLENSTEILKKEIIDAIQKIDNEEELKAIKATLSKKVVEEKISTLSKSLKLNDKEIKFIETLINASKVSVESKIELIELLKDENNKITKEHFTKPNNGTFESLIPKTILKNDCFNSIKNDIYNYSQQSAKGVGKFELMLLLLGKNSSKPKDTGSGKKGDVIIDGWHIEIKAGGAIHAGNVGVAKGKVTDINQLVINYAKKNGHDITGADPLYFRLAPTGRQVKKTAGGDWFWQFLKKIKQEDAEGLFYEYLKKLYGKQDPKLKVLAKKVIPVLGNSEMISKLFSEYIFDEYKAHEKFDSLLAVDLTRGVFSNSISSGIGMNKQMGFHPPATARGKSTYAIPDGGMGIFVK